MGRVEMKREELYKSIMENGINHKKTIKASEKLDKEVFKEMIKNPVNENIYLKQVIKSKDEEIRRLNRLILDLSEVAVMRVEAGETVQEAINSVVKKAHENSSSSKKRETEIKEFALGLDDTLKNLEKYRGK